jgi:hypothetical protein
MKTESVKIFDSKFSIKEASFEIAKLIPLELNLAEGISVRTYPFYNGRERSIALVIGTLFSKTQIVIVFGENRNSDNLFVDTFTQERDIYSEPRLSDFSDKAYKDRKFFRYDEFGTAAKFIEELIKDHNIKLT